MKKFVLIIFSVFLLTACTTTPPQWWDPAGRYAGSAEAAGKDAGVKPANTTVSQPPAKAYEPEEDFGYEDSFTPVLTPEVTTEPLPRPSVLAE